MNRTVFSAIAIASLWLPAGAFADDLSPPEITVTGTAEVKVVPDEFVLTASVESRGKTIEEATADNDVKISKVIDFLTKSGVPEKNIRTSIFRIESILVGESQAKAIANDPFQLAKQLMATENLLNPIGYIVKREMSVMSTKLDKFESMYRGLIERGVNNVDGIEFRTSQLRKHRDQARIEAIRAAKEKAEMLAGELGVTLTGVQNIRELSSRHQQRHAQNVFSDDPFGGETGPSQTIAAGQIRVSASVLVIFRLGSTDFQ